MKNSLRVMGFDPSLRNWGMASGVLTPTDEVIISEVGLVQPVISKGKQVRQNSKDLEAAHQLYKGVSDFIELHEPHALFVEVPHGSQSARAMVSYAICVGILGAIQEQFMSFFQLTENEVKLGTVGDKSASKAEMIDWAHNRHNDINWPTHVRGGETQLSTAKAEHMADAIASIEAGVKLPRFQQLRQMIA